MLVPNIMPKAIKNPDGSFELLSRGRPPVKAHLVVNVIVGEDGTITEIKDATPKPETISNFPVQIKPEKPVFTLEKAWLLTVHGIKDITHIYDPDIRPEEYEND